MDKLKEFWQESKADYESKYNTPFLTDYDKSLPYFEKMQELLLDMQKEDKNNVDVACLRLLDEWSFVTVMIPALSFY